VKKWKVFSLVLLAGGSLFSTLMVSGCLRKEHGGEEVKEHAGETTKEHAGETAKEHGGS